MKNEQLVYIAPCQEVEVELPFYGKTNSTCKKGKQRIM